MAHPYRADHVGSFLRPPELIDARLDRAEGKLTDEEVRAIEDRAILGILEVQRKAGLGVYSDGEYRRAMWLTGLPAACEGFVGGGLQLTSNWHQGDQRGAPPTTRASGGTPNVIGGKLRATRRVTGLESAFLKEHASGPYKITIPSPTWFLRGYQRGVSDQVYPTADDALTDLTAIVRDEVKALVAERVRYVQLDSIRYVFDWTDEERRHAWEETGIDPDAAIEQNIRADNAVIDGLKQEEVVFGLHMCRGNNRSYWFAEGGYDRIAERVFPALHYDALLLEYDSERAGGFEPLRHVPAGVTVVLGLISTKTPALEKQDDLLRRIEEAAKYVPLENLALSPQCGFASVADGNLLSWTDQRRKLELLVDTARKVWG